LNKVDRSLLLSTLIVHYMYDSQFEIVHRARTKGL